MGGVDSNCCAVHTVRFAHRASAEAAHGVAVKRPAAGAQLRHGSVSRSDVWVAFTVTKWPGLVSVTLRQMRSVELVGGADWSSYSAGAITLPLAPSTGATRQAVMFLHCGCPAASWNSDFPLQTVQMVSPLSSEGEDRVPAGQTVSVAQTRSDVAVGGTSSKRSPAHAGRTARHSRSAVSEPGDASYSVPFAALEHTARGTQLRSAVAVAWTRYVAAGHGATVTSSHSRSAVAVGGRSSHSATGWHRVVA